MTNFTYKNSSQRNTIILKERIIKIDRAEKKAALQEKRQAELTRIRQWTNEGF